ncbi:Ig-like domain-containing protein [Mycolicibacterium phlei]
MESAPAAHPEQPADPAPSPALWGVLAWARREAEREVRSTAVGDPSDVAIGQIGEGIPEEEPTNQPPVVESATYTIDYHQILEIRVVESAYDPDGDPMWISQIGKPSYGSAIQQYEGVITYTPTVRATNQMVTDKFSYTVTDAAGNSTTATVVVNIRPPEKPPTAVDDYVSTPADTPVTIDVLRNDDPPGTGALKLVSVSPATNGLVVLTRTGLVTYKPNTGFTGVDSFEYTVVDGYGGAHTATVTVQVLSNEKPGPTYTVIRGDKLTVPVEAGVRDPKYDGWKVSLEKKPSNGVLEMNADGSFTYVPNEGFVGEDTFVYSVSQGKENVGPFVAVITVTDLEMTEPIEFETPIEEPSYGVPFAASSAIGVCWEDWMPWQQGPGALNLTCLYPEARRDV